MNTSTSPSLSPGAQARQRPDWRPLAAFLVLIGLDFLVADRLTVWDVIDEDSYPVVLEWIESGLDYVVIAAAVGLWFLGLKRALNWLVIGYNAYLSFNLLMSVAILVGTLTKRKETSGAVDLVWDAALVWAMSITVFAIWYWLVDGGGPEERATAQSRPDFAFAQQSSPFPGWEGWRPSLFDYVHLSFTSSTAFSPADTVPLSIRAKFLTMVQSILSLVVLVSVVARAVNIIT